MVKRNRGAAGQQYAIIVGLIAVIAIASIATVGGSAKSVLTAVGNRIGGVANGSSANGTAPSGPADIGITLVSGARRFTDGARATSCQGYRVPATGYAYSGDIGDGLYLIDPDGAATTYGDLTVWCQMLPGKVWTLVVRAISGTFSHRNAAAIGTLTSVTQGTAWKLSDAAINAIPKTLYWADPDDNAPETYFDTNGSWTSTAVANNRPSPNEAGPFTGPYTDSAHAGLSTYQVGTGHYGTASPPTVFVYTGVTTDTTCRMGFGTYNSGWCGAGSSGNIWVR